MANTYVLWHNVVMAARSRQSVAKSDSSESQMTYSRFLELFPDNDACLDYLKAKFYSDGTECPKCGKPSKFHRIKGRSAYSCQFCGQHVYPTASTIFHKSTVSLQLWFWAIYLMSSTRCGISAKQLEREIGVSYPTAWRMFKMIRTLLADDDMLSGEVEMDEAYFGGKRPGSGMRGRPGKGSNKTPVFGMVQRGGNVIAQVVTDTRIKTLMPYVEARVIKDTRVFTDELKSYSRVEGMGYPHKRVEHGAKVYVDGDAHVNTIEGFWSLTKNGIRGSHHSVSAKYLQDYLNEYTFRFNRRDGSVPSFWAILDRVQKGDGLGVS
jgi:transposase